MAIKLDGNSTYNFGSSIFSADLDTDSTGDTLSGLVEEDPISLEWVDEAPWGEHYRSESPSCRVVPFPDGSFAVVYGGSTAIGSYGKA